MENISVYTPAQVGPSFLSDGLIVNSSVRLGRLNEQIVGQAHGKYHEANSRGKLFSACNQAVVTFGTALTATGVTFHLCNSIGSPVNLVVAFTTLTVLTGGTGGHIVYAWNPPSLTAVTAGTPLAVQNAFGSPGYGLAKSATTLPAAPTAIRCLAGVITAAGVNQIIDDADGSLIVAPGAQLSIQGITVVGTGLVGMSWEEVPLAA